MNKVDKIISVITSLLVSIVVLITVALVGVRLLGYDVYTVLSGSMEPTYKTGSLIYVKTVDHNKLKKDDVITFMLNEDTIVTHRIVDVIPDETDPSVIRFQTKGDANNSVDGSLVHYKNVIGQPKYTIPKLGYVANYIQNPPGTYFAIAGGIILLLLVFLPDMVDDEKE